MIKVLKAGIYSSIQDAGRFEYRKWGVPVSGAMDSYSAGLANQLVNNHRKAAVIEMTYLGATLQFLSSAIIAITGADFTPTIAEGQRRIHLNRPVVINRGTILQFGTARYGLRCYLAVKGGITLPKILGSRSYHLHIAPDYSLKEGLLLPIGKSSSAPMASNAAVRIKKEFFQSPFIPAFKGPEFGLLSGEMQRQLLKSKYYIAIESNRMGYRLEAKNQLTAPEIITSAVQPGTVQLTPSGQLIVLMRDCPTTGGYARVLQLTEEGINRLAQKAISHKTRLEFALK